jgi:transitional endoplasmic reticulum ATPase
MARRVLASHAWTFDTGDPVSVANGRIALALLRLVRQLPGAFPSRDYDDLGSLLAPVLERFRPLLRSTMRAYLGTRKDSALDLDDLNASTFLHERETHTIIGAATAQDIARFRPLIDKVEKCLADSVDRFDLPTDRNVAMLHRLIDLPAPDIKLLSLAAAFCYGTIERSNFCFVDSPPRILRSIELLCGVRGAAAIRMFEANGPLTRSGLLHALSAKRKGCDLDDLLCLSVIGEKLLGAPFENEMAMARAVMNPLQPAPARRIAWPHLARQTSLLKAALARAVEESVPGVNFLLYGAPGTGKTEFVRQLVADVGASGFLVGDADDDGDEATRSDRLASLQLSQTFAGQTTRSVLVLDEAEDIFRSDYGHPLAGLLRSTSESKAWMNALLERNPRPVIWISNRISQLDPAYLRRFSFCLEFVQTPQALRRQIAEERLGPLGCSARVLEDVAAIPQVTPAHLDAAARFADLSRDSGVGVDASVRTMIDAQMRACGHTAPPPVAMRSTRFDMRYLNVAGNATPRNILEALERADRDAGATLLFSGAPGTGKTQLAAEVASRLGRLLVVRTASDIASKWYGESEANVARMFRESDPATEVLFIDEAEILLGAREDSAHRADRAVTAEFLRWLEVFKGTFICATNHASTFDAALMRRFTFRLEFQPLRFDQRLDLYAELVFGRSADAGSPDGTQKVGDGTRDVLARLDRLTPGDFANVARRVRSLGLPAEAWIDELLAEHDSKAGATRRRVGFL